VSFISAMVALRSPVGNSSAACERRSGCARRSVPARIDPRGPVWDRQSCLRTRFPARPWSFCIWPGFAPIVGEAGHLVQLFPLLLPSGSSIKQLHTLGLLGRPLSEGLRHTVVKRLIHAGPGPCTATHLTDEPGVREASLSRREATGDSHPALLALAN